MPIIKYSTFLIYTSNQDHSNQLINQITNPHQFILDSQVEYYDASQPEAYGETFESTKCQPEQGSANYQNKSGQDRVYVCQKLLNEDLAQEKIERLFSASILYHEANHKYQSSHNYRHQEDIGKGQISPSKLMALKIATSCEPGNYPLTDNRRDQDFASVYGSHINYLFSLPQNNLLSCSEQQYAFNKAEELMKTRLCQYPNQPTHGYTKPTCS